jgi:chemotaxis protein histidine kinase CheA
VSVDDRELLSLFIEEAGSRLERIENDTWLTEKDSQSPVEIRRELHALKGATRMMGLSKLADLCHRAEDILDQEDEIARPGFELILGELRDAFEGVAVPEQSGASRAGRAGGSERPPGQAGAGKQERMRVPEAVIDELADRGARLRVVASGAEGLAHRIFRLAALAERGVGERSPEQVLATLATSLRQVGMELESGQRTLRRLTDRHLDALLALQVQPFRPFLKILARHARELAESLGKTIGVKVVAGDVHLDRRIVDTLREAFLHLVRNAVDHGIESPAEREAAGKDAVGSLRLEASTGGDRLRIRVVDDGRGIDTASVVRTAIGRGLMSRSDETTIDRAKLLQFLFRSGFSTREAKTEVSGRGIGLDAVAATIRTVGGDVWLESVEGSGTTVTVEVPVARRGQNVLVLRVGRHHIAIPSAAAKAYRRVESDAIADADGGRIVEVGGQSVPARILADILGEPMEPTGVLVEMIVGGVMVGVVADGVLGEEEVMIRPVPKAAGALDAVEGITLLASGRPVPVLSPTHLGDFDVLHSTSPSRQRQAAQPVRVLLIDDSGVTREMVRRLLEDAGFSVVGVGSADEALLTLEAGEFDCLVTDIEMPGMDGLELTRKLREDSRFSDLPIIVVSTLDRPSDRLAGLESGADSYLTKQGLDARSLVTLVRRIGGGR